MPKARQPAKNLTPTRPVESFLRVIRGQKVILDSDLAVLYQVETKILNQAVRRNLDRFPEDFLFQLTSVEAESLRSQIVTLDKGRGRLLASLLHSPRAVQMNILIVRAFVRLREMIAGGKDLAHRIEKLERGHDRVASVIEILVDDIDRLAGEIQQIKALPEPNKRRIGFRVPPAKN